ncbi:hypothetical protein HYV50_01640, partial [Candidatus Pacearchaeota archaeon]|nr:hypothetical protein [Candidatus Pacearchaeota archaeon]
NLENNVYNTNINVVVNAPDVYGYINKYRAIVNEQNNIGATIYNDGFLTATNVNAKFYTLDREWNGTDYEESNLQLIDEVIVGSLASNGRIDINFSWTPTERGYQNVKLVLDAPGDGNLENNVYNTNINVVVNAPDVYGYINNAPDVYGYIRTRAALGINEETPLYVSIFNGGFLAAQNVRAEIYDITGTNRNLIWDKEIASIEPQDVIYEIFNYSSDIRGEHVLQLEVIANNDYDLSNNIYNVTILIGDLVNVTFFTNQLNSFESFLAYGYGSKGELEDDYIFDGSITLSLIDAEPNILIGYVNQQNRTSTGFGTIFIGSDLNPVMHTIGDIIYSDVYAGNLILYTTYILIPDWTYNKTRVILEEDLDLAGIPAGVEEELSLFTCSDWDLNKRKCMTSWQGPIEGGKRIRQRTISISGDSERVEAFALGIKKVGECSETDFGRDIYNRGNTTSIDHYGNNATLTDYCLSRDGKDLVEYYCSANGAVIRETISCNLGYTCHEGACVSDITRVIQPTKAEPNPMKKNRYISFVPQNAGKQTALRVKLTDLPTQFASFEGQYRWIGLPKNISELGGTAESNNPPNFRAAKLECSPVYLDWGNIGKINAYGTEIIPNSTYEVQAYDLQCGNINDNNCYSVPLIVQTSRWGDIVGQFVNGSWSAPDGRVDTATDVVAVLDKFRNLPTAPSKTRTDIEPALVDQKIQITDTSRVLDAFRGIQYPFSITQTCSSASASNTNCGNGKCESGELTSCIQDCGG